jgi:acetyl-CoA carboxylase biotin carboxyl carrier protein
MPRPKPRKRAADKSGPGKARNGPAGSSLARPRKGMKTPSAGADNSRGTTLGGFEVTELRRLIRLVQKTGIGELEVTSGGRTVRVSANATAGGEAVSIPAAGTAAPAVAAPAAPAAGTTGTEHLTPIVSPMVGTFYRAPAPDADPYVEVGDLVEVGQTVCIVEAMKLMNEIESEAKGRIVRILVDNTQPVEYGQKLFLIEPL